MTVLCILTAVFLVTGIFSMTEMALRQETARLAEKHGGETLINLFQSDSFKSLIPVAAVLFLFVLCAGVLMIAGSMNSSVAQRTQLFGMLRCIGMSRRQIIRYVVLEALTWCELAIPAGILAGTAVTWLLCAVLKYAVGGEWADMPQLGVSILGIFTGAVVGVLTVLIAAVKPAKKAAGVSPFAALSGKTGETEARRAVLSSDELRIEQALGIRHATESRKNLILMTGSFALSIILFLCFSVFIDLVNCLVPQSASSADIEIYSDDELIEYSLLSQLNEAEGVERAFGRRAAFDVEAECDSVSSINNIDIISFGEFDLEALKKDGMLESGSKLKKAISGEGSLVITDEKVGRGSVFSVSGTDIPVVGKLKYDPFSDDGSTGGKTTLIISDEAFFRLTGVSGYNALFVQLSGAASEENVGAIKALTGGRYKFIDQREYDTRGTYLAFLVCVYGFLVIVALVTILNIVNSISMSVSARIKQYGAMRAVGMSKRQLADMIKAEALTYAASGCAAGLVLGLILSGWLYKVLVTAHFPYAHWYLPLGELAIIAAFFALSVAAGISSPVKRLNGLSVTETVSQL